MKAKTDAEKEAVLTTLEQLSQTMEAMNQVINRLKRRVEAVESASGSAQELDEDDLIALSEETILH